MFNWLISSLFIVFISYTQLTGLNMLGPQNKTSLPSVRLPSASHKASWRATVLPPALTTVLKVIPLTKFLPGTTPWQSWLLQCFLDRDWKHPLKWARDIQVCLYREMKKSQGTGSSYVCDNLDCLIACSLPHMALTQENCSLHTTLKCFARWHRPWDTPYWYTDEDSLQFPCFSFEVEEGGWAT